MGRELKRVPLDFNWPINKTWKGYENPYTYHDCAFCKNGYKPGTDRKDLIFCDYCEGSGQQYCDEKYRKLHEEWAPIDPPVGEGYQLWQTTGEGSPVSPVFKTLDELCNYAEKNCTTFGSSRAPATAWKKMLENDFVFHEEGNVIFI
jgi:hypothetical protein